MVTALAPVLPDKVAAAHFGDSMVLFLAGKDPRRDDQGFLHVMPHAGGWGGFEGGDGQDGLINNVNGGFKDYPVEVFEVKFPASIRRYEFRPDSGGPGRFRGGCGLLRRFEVDPASFLYLWLERSVTPGWGLFGGQDAVGPEVIINPGADDERRMLKVNAHPLDARIDRRAAHRRRGRVRPGASSATPSASASTCSTATSAARPPPATTGSSSTTRSSSTSRRRGPAATGPRPRRDCPRPSPAVRCGWRQGRDSKRWYRRSGAVRRRSSAAAPASGPHSGYAGRIACKIGRWVAAPVHGERR